MGMQSVSIIGIGRIGGALAIALSRAGFRIDYLVHRDASTAKIISDLLPTGVKTAPWSLNSPPKVESDVILITTADPDIAEVARNLRGLLPPESVILHTSGSLSSESLSMLESEGHHTGSMHPLVSVSDAVTGADNFSNAYFCIEGDAAAVSTASSIVEALGGRAFSIEAKQKPLYHAAAVTACGHLVALIDIAIEMLSKCGVDRDTAKQILLPLITSTINNLQTQSPERALTGSFARLDSEAVERHLAAIDREMPERIRDAYILLGERSIDLAARNGGDPADEQKLREVISIAKRKSG